MIRFSIRALLLITAAIALVVWWTDSGFRVVHDEFHPSYGRFVVYAKKGGEPGRVNVRVKHVPPIKAAGEVQTSNTMIFETDETSSFKLESVIDKNSGVWCLYDTCDANFVIIALRSSGKPSDFGNYWHPAVHIGWGRGFWAKLFDQTKSTHSQIPYDRLPSEAMIFSE